MKARHPVHVALRVTVGPGRDLAKDVIEPHREIAQRERTVFFGKIGRTFGDEKRRLLEESLGARVGNQLVLVGPVQQRLQFFSAELHSILAPGEYPLPLQVPDYYRHFIGEVTTWFEIGPPRRVSEKEVGRLRLVSNGEPLVETLLRCRTTMMLVE